MPYCVHCGVELESGTSACPLCETPVVDPAELGFPPPRPLYPEEKPAGIPKLSRRVILILCALLNLIPAFVTLPFIKWYHVCGLAASGGKRKPSSSGNAPARSIERRPRTAQTFAVFI